MVFLYGTTKNDNIKVTSDFDINNAGYSNFSTNSDDLHDHISTTYRPYGRNDYQLIFIKSGVGYFQFEINGEFIPIEPNNIIFFKPHEPQIYKFYCRDSTEIFWIHFGGEKTEKILKDCGIWEKKYFSFSYGDKFMKTVNSIMDEFKQRRDLYKLCCISKLMNLFVTIKRRDDESLNSVTERIKHICAVIENNYFLDSSNEEYANICHMSQSYFLKKFKERTGTTPQQYKINCRIKNAEEMLTQSNLKITEISQMLGFANSMYFSRVFQKAKGSSPTEYRKKAKEKDL